MEMQVLKMKTLQKLAGMLLVVVCLLSLVFATFTHLDILHADDKGLFYTQLGGSIFVILAIWLFLLFANEFDKFNDDL
jgi:uncharacterized membrane protein YidH (DUF202 family)